MRFEWNWADIVITIIGAFLAIILATVAEALGRKYKKRKEKKRIKKEIYFEFIKFADRSNENGLNFINNDIVEFSKKFDFPYLNFIIKQGVISIFNDKEDRLFYAKLVNLNCIISEINMWYQVRANFFLMHFENYYHQDEKTRQIFESIGREIISLHEKIMLMIGEIKNLCN